MIEKKKMKPGPAVKGTQPKPARKKHRLFLWIFLMMFLFSALVGAGFYYRLIPLDQETALKLEPYIVKAEEMVQESSSFLVKMDPYLEKLKVWKNQDEEKVDGKPKTNFPLVELEDNKKTTTPPIASSSVLGAPSVASASPAQPTTSAEKLPSGLKDSADTAKVYGKLSKLYGAMKTEEAVAVFKNLEDEQVVIILSRMEEEAASRVLATMEPKRAARLTQAMIKRK
ncbi:MAG: MotE family protein [Negativicutes bacterium]